MSNPQEVQSAIEAAIEATRQLFRTKPDYLLTEEDLRCRLFQKFQDHPCLIQEAKTQDGTLSVPLHAEVRWYGNGRLKCRSDLVALRVGSLKTRNGPFELPSKGFGFNRFDAVIELKLRRKRGESDNVFIKKIREDVDKLLKVKEQTRDGNQGAKFYVVVFDRKTNIQNLKRKVKNPFPDDTPMDFFYEPIA